MRKMEGFDASSPVVWILMLMATSSLCAADEMYCSQLVFHRCDNLKCVLQQWVCDGEDDCGDGSDEQLCERHECSTTDGMEFECANHQCVPSSWRCDGDFDCDDHSDELQCQSVSCPVDYFSCGNGSAGNALMSSNSSTSCIPTGWLCDGRQDCPSGLDEINCNNQTCTQDEFQCTQDANCITSRWVCDGDADCRDGSDETNCPAITCAPDQWQCDNSQCVPASWHCDGSFDCADHSDEANCATPGAVHYVPVASNSKPACHDGEFQCRSGECIHGAWRCDMDRDCEDGSDEQVCMSVTCLPTEFQCHAIQRCIPLHLKCDGIDHCSDNSDELSCSPRRQTCDPVMEFDCTQMTSDNCITVTAVCDGQRDCHGSDDENETLCSQRNHTNVCPPDNGCSHSCVVTYNGYFCSCPTGFVLGIDHRTCKDIDECAAPAHCSQLCENRVGSFKCSCHPGFFLDPEDRRTCRALGREPTLLFTNRHDLRQLHLYSGRYHLLVDGMHSAIAVDFDISASTVFWTDVTSENISRVVLDENGIPTQHEVLVSADVSTPDGLAFDWAHRNLYWTDAGRDRIEVLGLYGEARWRRTLISSGLDEPRALVIDPREKHRAMYWTDWGSQPKIEKACLDGSDRHAIVTDSIQWPNGLTLDFESDRLFWVDAKLHVIFSSDLSGQRRQILLTSFKYLMHPFSVAVFEDDVYWTDWQTQSIYKVNRLLATSNANDTLVQTVADKLLMPMDVAIYHSLKQPRVPNACASAPCSHLCLPTVRYPQYICLCPNNASDITYTLVNNKCLANNVTPAREPESMQQPVANGAVQRESRRPTNVIIIVIGVVIGIAAFVVLLMVFVLVRRCYRRKNIKTMNFDNPVYRKTTAAGEETFSLDKHIQQQTTLASLHRIPSAPTPRHQSPLLQPLNTPQLPDNSLCV